jgi:two-component system cell cycle sensor histidine kinase/response regulator CckA
MQTPVPPATETKHLPDRDLLFSHITEHMFDLVALTDMEGTFTHFAKSIRQLGYGQDDLVGKHILELVHPEDIPEVTQALTDLLREQRQKLTPCRCRTAWGNYLWLEVLGHVVIDADGIARRGIFSGRIIQERKETELALQRHQQYTDSLLAAIPDLIFVLDREGRFLDARAPGGMRYYRPREEFIHRNVRDVLPEAVSAVILRGLAEVLAGRPFPAFEYRLRMSEAPELSEFECALSPFGEHEAIAVVRDITQHKRTEDSLRASENKWRSYVESAPIGVFVVDRAGQVLEANPAASLMTGFADAELRQKHFFDLLAPESRTAGYHHLRQVVGHGQAIGDFRYVHRDGGTRWCSLSAVRLGDDRFLGFAVEITARKEFEHSLEMTRETYRVLLDSLRDAIFVQDERGVLLDVNRGTEHMLGRERAALLGRDTSPWHSPDRNDPAAIRSLVEEVFQTGEPRRFEIQARRGNGEDFPMEILAHKSVWFGRPAVVSIARDLSEQRRAEAEKDRLREDLAHAQKMETVGRLAGGIAHEFNNMLGVIMGYAELALAKTGLAESLAEDLRQIQKAAERSVDITRQLLTFAHKDGAGSPTILEVNESIGGMLGMLGRLLGENLRVEWTPGDGVGCVRLDPTHLNQILSNLLLNARDATGAKGQVRVATERLRLDAAACAHRVGVEPGPFVRLTVADNGKGMDEKVLSCLFEPFFSTKETGKGTGLGLSIVYGLVSRASGFIEVKSRMGQGTTFAIFLPASDAVASSEPSPPVEADPRPARNRTILLVEDEAAILKLAQVMLSKSGYQVLAAADTETAMRISRENPASIDLLLTDVVMPGMDGHELSMWIAAQQPGMRCLYMSGYPSDVIARHGIPEVGQGFLQKPFSVKDLLRAVRVAMDGV